MSNTITISTNYWRVPSERNAFDGWLEGEPTPQERQQVIAKAAAARAVWKPSPEGWALVEQLKAFSGFRVRLQLWDNIMWMLPEEAPFPFESNCKGVTLQNDGEFLQAYLLVDDVKVIATPDGYSPEGYFQQRPDCNYLLVPFSRIYEVAKIGAASK